MLQLRLLLLLLRMLSPACLPTGELLLPLLMLGFAQLPQLLLLLPQLLLLPALMRLLPQLLHVLLLLRIVSPACLLAGSLLLPLQMLGFAGLSLWVLPLLLLLRMPFSQAHTIPFCMPGFQGGTLT